MSPPNGFKASHNPKVAGSNPAPATDERPAQAGLSFAAGIHWSPLEVQRGTKACAVWCPSRSADPKTVLPTGALAIAAKLFHEFRVIRVSGWWSPVKQFRDQSTLFSSHPIALHEVEESGIDVLEAGDLAECPTATVRAS